MAKQKPISLDKLVRGLQIKILQEFSCVDWKHHPQVMHAYQTAIKMINFEFGKNYASEPEVLATTSRYYQRYLRRKYRVRDRYIF